MQAGSICPQITPPLIAAQLEQESGWRADAVAHNPASRGGDAMGIAQFQQGIWDTWGEDGNGNGTISPWEPEDAIMSQGRLMCDHGAWADRQVAAGALTGDVVDLALAAYFCGRQCVLNAGGVPAGGLAAACSWRTRPGCWCRVGASCGRRLRRGCLAARWAASHRTTAQQS